MAVHFKTRFDILNINWQMVVSQLHANKYNEYNVLYSDMLLATLLKTVSNGDNI